MGMALSAECADSLEMTNKDDQLTQILARVYSIEKKSESSTRWTVFVGFLTGVFALVGSWWIAQATLKSSDRDNASEQSAFVAAQRRDSYATLGHTVRKHIRSLQLASDTLQGEHIPDPPVSVRNGEAYRETREVAVDTELVGDDKAGKMARCMVAGFDEIGLNLRLIEDELRAGSASAGRLDNAKASLKALQEYETDFIEYGAEHLFPDEDTTSPRTGGTDPACLWKTRDLLEP
jgi:hypothetical protein